MCGFDSYVSRAQDLKPNNLLYASDGKMKLADFGLARSYGSPGRHMTPTVVTRWYRPPELCFGCREYGAAVDMWGVSVSSSTLKRVVALCHTLAKKPAKRVMVDPGRVCSWMQLGAALEIS